MGKVPKEAGKSSFDLIDQRKLFDTLPASGVNFILDLGCGVGNYLFALAGRYPGAGKLIGVDLWPEGIDILNRNALDQGLTRVRGVNASGLDLSFVDDSIVDLLLMATVLHDLAERGEESATLSEVSRVLRPGGTLAVVEFKKVQTVRGPPVPVRISENELLLMLKPYGLAEITTLNIGPQCYLSTFQRIGT